MIFAYEYVYVNVRRKTINNMGLFSPSSVDRSSASYVLVATVAWLLLLLLRPRAIRVLPLCFALEQIDAEGGESGGSRAADRFLHIAHVDAIARYAIHALPRAQTKIILRHFAYIYMHSLAKDHDLDLYSSKIPTTALR